MHGTPVLTQQASIPQWLKIEENPTAARDHGLQLSNSATFGDRNLPRVFFFVDPGSSELCGH